VALSTSSVCYAGLLLVVSCAHILLQFHSALQRSLERLRRSHDELQASRARIVAAADAERRRIERDLHDGAQQHLTSLAVKLLLAATLAGPDSELAGLLEDLGAELKDTAQELRNLVHGIYPPLLRDNGLAAALSDAARLCTLPTTVRAASLGRYPADIEAAVYFCCLEALQNAGKHAGERATIRLRVREDPGTLAFEVIDDGAGFDTRDHGIGAGLRNMADRMGAFGGRLLVESAPGEGTRVTGAVPVPVAPGSGASAAAQLAAAGPVAGGTDETRRAARELVGLTRSLRS
jgi:signal transduction histidine kinase